MRTLAFALVLPLAACAGSAQKQDLANAGKARSLLAEASLIAEMAPRTSATYTAQMRSAALEELAALAATSRRAGGPDGQAIAALATVPASADAASLRGRAAHARAIEQRLEAGLEGS